MAVEPSQKLASKLGSVSFSKGAVFCGIDLSLKYCSAKSNP